MTKETLIKVRYVETDQMGVVHHSNYYHWFEVGRTEFLNDIGMNYGEIERQGVMTPLIESHCSYRSPAKYEDELVIKTSIEYVKPTRMEFSYEVIRISDGKLLADGKTVHTFINKIFKPINLKKENMQVYNLFESCIE